MKIVCLNKRWKHHTTSGGYDHLSDALGAIDVRRPDLTSAPARIIEKAWNFGFGDKPYLHKYTFEDRLAEEMAYWTALRRRAQILHALFGDEQLDMLLGRTRFLPARMIATFHLPAHKTIERFERIQRDELKRLAGAIVVSSGEVKEIARWLGPEKVIYVPHGIDTKAFTPGQGNSGTTTRFVFVGLHLRDFEVAHYVADRCALEKLDVIFDVVLPAEKFAFFTGCTNVRRHSGISETALIELYQNADALFLPVIDATANNAVLEAMACGTPVVSTAVGGISDYVSDESGWLLPLQDGSAAFECVKHLIGNRELMHAKRQPARLQAERFSWECIAAELVAAYRRLLATGRFAD